MVEGEIRVDAFSDLFDGQFSRFFRVQFLADST